MHSVLFGVDIMGCSVNYGDLSSALLGAFLSALLRGSSFSVTWSCAVKVLLNTRELIEKRERFQPLAQ